jgi:hypothetical protein
MKSHLGIVAVAVLALAAASGCAHRTTVHRTNETVREVTPPPVVEDSTTVIKHSNTRTEETRP